MDALKKWKNYAIIAVVLVGLGINLVAEATIIKANSPDYFDLRHMALWFWIGLAGLASINAGISFMAESVKHRIYAEQNFKEPGKPE
ncbi:MAG: hypothetical protein LAT75_01655 [Candidatus Cyclonatronum sp.]|uniref:hypothetical protein n=1 Tax=Cyclonatronum sp. TaxID=3024185 RepID=UPI0025BE3D11|nr:hypothetical protein [Cyclonatronum sp.]MCC5933149.1 hypothetical protein [Balneolales bacterium]MCH8485537.1 hypothetical protein [Cyclonatronum sp.]